MRSSILASRRWLLFRLWLRLPDARARTRIRQRRVSDRGRAHSNGKRPGFAAPSNNARAGCSGGKSVAPAAAVQPGTRPGRECRGGLLLPPPGAARPRQPRTFRTRAPAIAGPSGHLLPRGHRLRWGERMGGRAARRPQARQPCPSDRLRSNPLLARRRRGLLSLVAREGEGEGWWPLTLDSRLRPDNSRLRHLDLQPAVTQACATSMRQTQPTNTQVQVFRFGQMPRGARSTRPRRRACPQLRRRPNAEADRD